MPSKIEWTDETLSVVTGCSHAGSPGCDSCYAARMAATRLKHHPRYAGLATIEDGRARWTGEVRLNYDVLEQPRHWKKPRRVFVASMGDWLHHGVSELFIYRVLDITRKTPQHIYQFLTKRADRLPTIVKDWMLDRGLYEPPSNVWQGVSIENQAAADERIPLLLQTPAAVRFVSVEPCLSGVDLTYLESGTICALTGWYTTPGNSGCQTDGITTWGEFHEEPEQHFDGQKLDWVICGGESGPNARPMHPDWARSLRDQCQAAGTPYFFKQHGAWVPVDQWEATCQEKIAMASLDRVHHWPDGSDSLRVGKKRAGHLLDGRVWREFPECS